MQDRIDLVAKYLTEMPPGTPDALRQNVMTILDQAPAVPPICVRTSMESFRRRDRGSPFPPCGERVDRHRLAHG